MQQKPLAERMRPQSLQDYSGQQHLVGPGAPIYEMLESGRLCSFILWGPPGVGKTTLAHIIAQQMQLPFYTLSAVSSGVKEVRAVLQKAEEEQGLFRQGTPILFIDEIHRFSKSQQDSLLHAIEQGVVTLIGATTENPSFEVIRPLLSRCRVFTLEPLSEQDMEQLIELALHRDEELQKYQFVFKDKAALYHYAAGDARKLLNILELLTSMPEARKTGTVRVEQETLKTFLQQNAAAYDKDGELHYDIISAFIKSIRGSAPNAALYYLARMIEGGEDPKFIARRLLISASEDIGLANPNAMLLAQAAFDTVERIGWPEARIPLAEVTIYLATSPKSNSAYAAIRSALAYVRANAPHPVPLHLRNAVTDLMGELGYGENYEYPHDYPGHFRAARYLPEEMRGTAPFWQPADNPAEKRMAEDRPLND